MANKPENSKSGYNAVIAGTGSHLPEKILTNEDLTKIVETSDEWITTRTGIKTRRVAGPDETTATLAAEAAKKPAQTFPWRPRDFQARKSRRAHGAV